MKLITNPKVLSLLILIFLSIFALKSLTTPGSYTSHDGETHMARIAQYYLALTDGQFPPRFASSFYNGLGSPIFVYIYPLPYLFGSFVHLVGANFSNSFKIIMALGFVLSQLFAFFWLKEVFKSPKAAFLGALFYGWAPYRFSLIYVRASISELLGYTFVPLALLSVTKLLSSKRFFWIPIAGISISLVMLSQNLVAVITLPVIFAYSTVIAFSQKSPKSLLRVLAAFIWGGAISAFTYLPSLFEIKFTRFNEIITKTYPNHFVTLKQLIHSPWGYGFDLPGTLGDQLSFQLGLAHILVFAITIVIIAHIILKLALGKRSKSMTPQLLFQTTFFIAIFILAIFLTLDTKTTKLIWENFKFLHVIDIPWRLLGVCTISTAFFAAFVAKSIKSGFLFIFLIAAVLIANRNFLRINEAVIHDDKFFQNYTGTATQYNEFTPIWRQTTRPPVGIDPQVKTKIFSGEADVANVAAKSSGLSFDAQVHSPEAQIRVNRFYFPKTEVTVDGKKLSDVMVTTSLTKKQADPEEDASGMPLVRLTQGFHHVTVAYKETPLRLFSDYLSLISFLAALILLARYAKK